MHFVVPLPKKENLHDHACASERHTDLLRPAGADTCFRPLFPVYSCAAGQGWSARLPHGPTHDELCLSRLLRGTRGRIHKSPARSTPRTAADDDGCHGKHTISN